MTITISGFHRCACGRLNMLTPLAPLCTCRRPLGMAIPDAGTYGPNQATYHASPIMAEARREQGLADIRAGRFGGPSPVRHRDTDLDAHLARQTRRRAADEASVADGIPRGERRPAPPVRCSVSGLDAYPGQMRVTVDGVTLTRTPKGWR